MYRLEQLHWPLIVRMGSLALVWPFLSLTGLLDRLGRPSGPILLLTFISGVWLAIVVLTRVRQPFLTLSFTGFTYAVFALLIHASLSPIDGRQLSSPLSYLFVIIARLGYGIMWGSVMGIIAWAIRQVFNPVNGVSFTEYQSQDKG